MDPPDDFVFPRTPQYSCRLASAFLQFQENAECTDFRLRSGEEVFPCHQVIIGACSPVLMRIIRAAGMKEARDHEARLDGIPPAIVQNVLRYMYTGDSRVPADQLLDTIQACDFLELLELKASCLGEAVNVFRPENIISWSKLTESLNLDSLQVMCSDILMSELVEVSHGQEFLELCVEELKNCLEEVQRAHTEPDDALEALMSWVIDKPTERSNNLADLLDKIHLTDCSIEVLTSQINTHRDLLESHPSAYNLLNAIITNDHNQGGRMRQRRRKKSQVILVGNCGGDQCWEFVACHKVVPLTTLPFTSVLQSLCVTDDGFVVSGCGTRFDRCYEFIASENRWKELPRMLNTRKVHASCVIRGRLFVLCGLAGNETSNVHLLNFDDASSDVHSLSAGTWDIEPDTPGAWDVEPDTPIKMPTPQVACIDNNIFLLCCESGKLYRMDTQQKVWSRKENAPEEDLTGSRMIAVQDTLFVATTFIVFQYVPSINQWSAMTNQPLHPHRRGAFFPLQHKLFLIGATCNNNIERYDMLTGTWSVSAVKLPEKATKLHAVVING